MKKQILLLISFCFIFSSSFAQKQDWFDADYRSKIWPSSLYYKQYSNGANDKEALDNAKKELSKSILSQIETKSTSTGITKNGIYNDLFKEKSSETSSATFVNLNKKISFTNRKKVCHVFIYKSKEELKKETKNIFANLQISYISDVGSLIRIYNTKNIKEAKNKSDKIKITKRKLERLKTFLSVFGSEINTDELNQANQKYDEVRALILNFLTEEQNYKSNKDKADLLFSSSNIQDLEKSLELFKQAQRINPDQAKEDDIPADIEILRNNLFNKYIKFAKNFELEQKFPDAIEYYQKSRELFPNKKADTKTTTTERILICQEELIKIIISQGDEELEDYPKLALNTYEEAKDLAIELFNNTMIKPINKKIKKAKEEINKNINRDLRAKSSNRLLLNIGGGIQTNYSYYKNFFDQEIDPDSKNWNINATFGYRSNLPDEKETYKTGFEKSKGNVLAVFIKKGKTNVASLNMTNIDFTEVEFGYIARETLRLSFGFGNRSIGDDVMDIMLQPSNYYCGTTSIIMHKDRVALEIGATWLFNNEFEPIDAKLSANFNLKFYFLQKVYKTLKK
tara:strand:+ start:889 stop:2595 length:1707 start_codon:yes stop_codon:yes gene_type:complete